MNKRTASNKYFYCELILQVFFDYLIKPLLNKMQFEFPIQPKIMSLNYYFL